MIDQSLFLFRTEAGPQIGFGHLRRSLSLALALRERGIPSRFVVNEESGSLQPVVRLGFEISRVPQTVAWTGQEVRQVCELSRQAKVSAVVVDAPQVSRGYLQALQAADRFVVLRDDVGRVDLPAHVFLNGNADAAQLPYRASEGTLLLLGPEYAVLSPEFWQRRSPETGREIQNVLITMGGSDFLSLTPRLMELLDEMPGEFTVTAVLGPFFKELGKVRQVAASARKPMRILEDPVSLYPPILEADLAISAAGQTLYELACLGCPTVAIQVSENQKGQLRALAGAGAVWPGGSMEKDGDLSGVQAGVGRLLADPGARAAMSAAGRKLVDGAGARRVAEAIGREVEQLAGA